MQQVAYAEFRFIFVLRERKPDGRKRHPIFLGLFYKSATICFYCECTQIKANLLQFRLSSWLKGVVASTVRRKKKIKWLLQRRMQCSLFIIIIKNNQSNIWKKTHCSVKIVVKSVPLSVITVPLWSYAKHVVFRGYWNVSEAGLHKR